MHRISLPSVAVWQMFCVQITVKKLVFCVDMYKALVSGKQRWNTLLRKELAVPATIR